MKSFKELSLNITEEEYRNNGRFHYSDIAGYMREGFSYLKKTEKDESESLKFGSVVDCMLTEEPEVFLDRFCVITDFNLSDNQKAVIQDLIQTGYDKLEDIPSDMVLEALQAYYKNPKTQFSKLIEDGSSYYRYLKLNEGKTAIDVAMYNDAVETSTAIFRNETTAPFFTKTKIADVDKFYQLKFDGEIEGIPVCAMVDVIYVEHSTKRIWLIDLKTTCANYEWEFPKSFVKYRYDVQAKLYSQVVRQCMDKDDFYKDYQIEGFTFVYVSRKNKQPLLWTFDQGLFSDYDIVIDRPDGKKIVLDDYRHHLRQMFEIKEYDYQVPIGIWQNKGNDILFHLKEDRI